MTFPDDDVPTPARWPHPLVLSADARGSEVRVLRRDLADWLRGDHLGGDVVEDLVSAASEALENCCDHAYDPTRQSGTMTLTARCLPEDDRDGVVITVEDDGHWRAPRPTSGFRGRGLSLMRALVDDVVVHTSARGTTVSLIHHPV